MLRMWVTFTTIINTALAVAGLGVAGYAVTAKPGFILFYYAVALICVAGSTVGFVNLWFLNEAVRRSDEKHRPAREERERKKAERAAKRAEKEAAKAQREAEREAAEAAAQAMLPEEPEEPAAPEEPEGNEDITILG